MPPDANPRPLMRLVFCALAALLLAACSGSTSTPPGASSPELFHDDFAQDLGLWETFAEPDAATQIADGRLTITLTASDTFAFSLAAINLTDFDLTVTATLLGGGLPNSHGVIFRYIDRENFYRFDISGDGLWGVSRRSDDQWVSIVELAPSQAINTGAAMNAIRIVGRGSKFVFYANGAELGRVTDSNLPVGRIGLFASTFDDPNTQVSFDNLIIVNP